MKHDGTCTGACWARNSVGEQPTIEPPGGAFPLANHNHDLALAGAVLQAATVAAMLFHVRGLHVAAEIGAVDFHGAAHFLVVHVRAHGLTDLVGHHESRLVLAIQVTAELQGGMSLGAVHEDGDCQQVVADRELAIGEDRAGRDRELVAALFAAPDRLRLVGIDGQAATRRAEGLAVVGRPPHRLESLARFLIAHTGDLSEAQVPCGFREEEVLRHHQIQCLYIEYDDGLAHCQW